MNKKELTFAKQSHVISKAVYSMSATSRKLVFFTMAKSEYLEDKDEFEIIEVTTDEIVKGLGLKRGGTTYDTLKSITKQTKAEVFTIEEDGYDHVSWMEVCRYIASKDVFEFQLHKRLKKYVPDVKSHFSLIPLTAVGKLQGKYSIRIFELVMTQSGQEGQNGNKPGSWWYEESVEMLRHMLEVPIKYPTAEFRRRVIDCSVSEINDARIGIKVKPLYLRKGRSLIAIRFEVSKQGDKEPVNVTKVQTETDVEHEDIKAKYPVLFAKYYQEEMDQQTFSFLGEGARQKAAEAAAVRRIIAENPKKRGKPKS